MTEDLYNEAIAILEAERVEHDRRVTDLLAAKNVDVERRRTVLGRLDLVHGEAQAGVVHAGDDAHDRRDVHRHERVFALGLVHDDDRVVAEVLVRRPVEVPAEDRRAGRDRDLHPRHQRPAPQAELNRTRTTDPS